MNEIQLPAFRSEATLTYGAYQPDGTVRTAAGTSLPEVDSTGYYKANDANVIFGDAVVIKEGSVVVAGGFYGMSIAAMSAIASATWNELLTGETHNIVTSAGRRLRELASNVIISGISPNTNGTANTVVRIELDNEASSEDGCYDPANILIYEGTGIGQSRQIWEYDGTTKYAYINRDWKTIPDNTSKYIIYGSTGNTHINEGLAGGGTFTSITLNSLASSQDDTYKGQMVFIAAGTGQDQAGTIIAYNGTTKVATIERAWPVAPGNSQSMYAIIPMSRATIAEIRTEMDSNSTEFAAIKAIVENIVAVAPINVSRTSNVIHRS